jgi:hypothetical protein
MPHFWDKMLTKPSTLQMQKKTLILKIYPPSKLLSDKTQDPTLQSFTTYKSKNFFIKLSLS